jgi:AP-1 complex subunit beta-1
LRSLIDDSNPMVVANAVAALCEIGEASDQQVLETTHSTVSKLCAALAECTEWGQIFILDALTMYKPDTERATENLIERVTPRLQHGNPAVSLSAIKIIMLNLERTSNQELVESMCKKMGPPLVTLLSSEPEIQYVALRNINLIVQRRPDILDKEIKVFFCKYNDPVFVKMEKLDVMVKLANSDNVETVLMELKEYAQEVDVDFVRKAVRAIGRVAITLESAAERCINTLYELIQLKVNYVVQEAIVVIKDIFRRYPNQYESIIATLCENLESLDEPEAKGSMIWIIGEYADRIDGADEILDTFLETFTEENSGVQLQLLTATVKLFLKTPTEQAQDMIRRVLSSATNETDNPDLRDRAYIYWRLLSSDPEAARDVVLAEKATISAGSQSLEPALLDELIANLGTLSSVYHKPPDTFASRRRAAVLKADEADLDFGDEDDDVAQMPSSTADMLGSGDVTAQGAQIPSQQGQQQTQKATPANDLIGDLLGEGNNQQQSQPQPAAAGGLDDLLGGPEPVQGAGSAQPAERLPTLLSSQKGQGLQIDGSFCRESGKPVLRLHLINQTSGSLDGFQIQFNKNPMSIAPAQLPIPVSSLPPGGSATGDVGLVFTGTYGQAVGDPPQLQIAVKSPKQSQSVHYFSCAYDILKLFQSDGELMQNDFLQQWRGMDAQHEQTKTLNVTSPDADSLNRIMKENNIFVVAQRQLQQNQTAVYASAKAPPSSILLMQCALSTNALHVTCRAQHIELAPILFASLERAFG